MYTHSKNQPTKTEYKNVSITGAWVAQSIKLQTLDFSSGHDLTVCEFEPHVGLCVMPGHVHILSLSLKNK